MKWLPFGKKTKVDVHEQFRIVWKKKAQEFGLNNKHQIGLAFLMGAIYPILYSEKAPQDQLVIRDAFDRINDDPKYYFGFHSAFIETLLVGCLNELSPSFSYSLIKNRGEVLRVHWVSTEDGAYLIQGYTGTDQNSIIGLFNYILLSIGSHLVDLKFDIQKAYGAGYHFMFDIHDEDPVSTETAMNTLYTHLPTHLKQLLDLAKEIES